MVWNFKLRLPSRSFRWRTVAVSLVLAITVISGCTYLGDAPKIGDDFTGDELKGVSYGIAESVKENPAGGMVRVLAVHGMGKHCIGHSETLIENLAMEMGLREKPLAADGEGKPAAAKPPPIPEECDPDPEVQEKLCKNPGWTCKVIKKTIPETKKSFTYGFVRIRDYVKAGAVSGKTRLRFFELTWDPTTRWAIAI